MRSAISTVIRFHTGWLAAARAEGEECAPTLLALPVAEWRTSMDDDPRLRSYGTLAALLDAIHEDLQQHPAVAYERVVVVLSYVDAAPVPTPTFGAWLRGSAWREYANALRLRGNPKDAVAAAVKSREIFDSVPSLEFDAAKSDLVQAQARRQIDDFDTALALARRATSVFGDHGDSRYFMFGRMTEAWVLFGRKQFQDAFGIFSETAKAAEALGDKKTLAGCLYNLAECARAVGDEVRGHEFNKRAVELLSEVPNAIDAPRVRWAHALDTARQGRTSEAIMELFKVRGEFLAMGLNTDAATAALDCARIKVDRGEDISALCTELVQTFSEAGMTQSALESLAYLREEAKRKRVTTKKIKYVRTHINEVARMPALLFAPPPEDGE